MAELPTGTVTFLFTDLEGSTELAHRLEDEWHGVLVAHRHLIRAAVNDANGSEIDCRGDEFFVAFDDASAAAEAAVVAQRSMSAHPWPEDTELRVRMGMHTGHAIFADQDYLGIDVHRAARICFAGHGGQILMSEATQTLLPDEVERRDLGSYRLRGIPGPERIYQLLAPGLGDGFPALRFVDHDDDRPPALRVVLADDSVLLREGIALLLEQAGFEIVGQSDDAEDLLRKVDETLPDVAVIDIRMPPCQSDEGLQAAKAIRAELPEVGVLVLSAHLDERYARKLLEDGSEGVGYLLKDRIAEIERFTSAVRRIALGGSVLDPEVVATMIHGRRDALDELTCSPC
jgi:class 3 adenylate cyclase/DNA-binding NarL/FixJ family response regulator